MSVCYAEMTGANVGCMNCGNCRIDKLVNSEKMVPTPIPDNEVEVEQEDDEEECYD